MKYPVIFVALSTLAVLQGTVVTNADPQFGLFGDFAHGFASIGQDIFDGVFYSVSDGVNIADNFLGHVNAAASVIARDSLKLGQDVAHGTQDIIQQNVVGFAAIVRSFAENLERTVQNVRNRIKRIALQNVLTSLERINATSSELGKTIANISWIARTEVKLEQQHLINGWGQWADEQLARVADETNNDNAKQQEAKSVLDEVVQRYSIYLGSCSDELEVQIQKYETSVENTISKYQSATEDLLTSVQDCLVSDNSNRAAIKCRKITRRQLDIINSAPRDLLSMKLEGIELAERGLDGNACAINTLTQFELEKHNILRQLKEIIEQPSDGDDDNDSSDDSDDDSNDSNDSNDSADQSNSSSAADDSADESNSGSAASNGDADNDEAADQGSSSSAASNGDADNDDAADQGSSSSAASNGNADNDEAADQGSSSSAADDSNDSADESNSGSAASNDDADNDDAADQGSSSSAASNGNADNDDSAKK